MAGIDQARRFIGAYKVEVDQYCSLLEDKNDLLRQTIDDCEKNLKRLRIMPHRSNDNNGQNRKLKRKMEDFEKLKAKFIKDKETLNRLRNKLHQAVMVCNDYLIFHFIGRKNGLAPARIQRFPLFTSDETHVGDQCSICMGDIDVGRKMMRLTCDGQHSFCQECIEGWFSDHNTCPLCRYKFD